MRLLDINRQVHQYALCEIPPVKILIDGKNRDYQAMYTVNLVRNIVIFDIVRAEGQFSDLVRRAYAAKGFAYAYLEEARIRQEPAFSNAVGSSAPGASRCRMTSRCSPSR
jgi:predicted methyltransferase